MKVEFMRIFLSLFAGTLLFTPGINAQIRVGFEPPDFSLTDSNNEKIDTLRLQGKIPVVISFFATYCRPCKKEIPFLIQKSDNQKKYKLVLVATDTGDKNKLAAFFFAMGVSHPYIYDRDGTLSQNYKTKDLPYTVFIGKSGKIAAVEKGFTLQKLELYDSIINSLGDN